MHKLQEKEEDRHLPKKKKKQRARTIGMRRKIEESYWNDLDFDIDQGFESQKAIAASKAC